MIALLIVSTASAYFPDNVSAKKGSGYCRVRHSRDMGENPGEMGKRITPNNPAASPPLMFFMEVENSPYDV